MTDDNGNEIDRAFYIYLRERFETPADFERACEEKSTFGMDWLVALPPDKRQLALAKVAKANNMGPCSLIRFSAGENCDTDKLGVYVVAQPIADDLMTAEMVKDGRVIVEVLEVYRG